MSHSTEGAPWVPTGISAHLDNFGRDHLPPQAEWPVMDYSCLPVLAAYKAQINCATELLDKQVAIHGDQPVIHCEAFTWTYAELLAKANQIAGVLVEDFGVKPGNRVMLRSPNNPMYVACWFAVMKVGAIAVATMPLLRARELDYIATAAEIEFALCDQNLADEMAIAFSENERLKKLAYFHSDAPDGLEARMAEKSTEFSNVDTAADDVCLIAFTSGTTGSPKGCMHFHRDILAINDTFSRYVLRPDQNDIFAGSPPIAFTFGLGALVTFPMSAGASTYLAESYTPDSMLAAIKEHNISVLFTAPTMYRILSGLYEAPAAQSLKICISAGEALPKPTWEDWLKASGIKIIDGLGATEMLHIFVSSEGDGIRPGATGKAIPGYQAKIVDDDGNDVAPGTVGRLAIRGPTGCRYMANPERQAAYVQDGWNFSGDAYLMDEDGYFFYQARTDDMIISAGYNISGPEVEAVLLEHTAVADCAVVAAPDTARGFIVKAYVVLNEGFNSGDETVKQLQDHVKATIAPYKYPRAVAFLSELPRTQTGKLQRFVLRQQSADDNS